MTPTHALLSGSPAVDAGEPTIPGSGGASCEIRDQRGVIRPQGNACDIGAYEIGVPLCAAPAMGCTAAADGRAALQLKQPGQAKLQWKWRGAVADPAQFGDPLGGAVTSSAFSTPRPARRSRRTPPSWLVGRVPIDRAGALDRRDSPTRTVSAPSGISALRLGTTNGVGRITLKGGGSLLALPTLPLAQDPVVLVQLQRRDGGACWESTLTTSKRKDVQKFLAP